MGAEGGEPTMGDACGQLWMLARRKLWLLAGAHMGDACGKLWMLA